MTGTETSPVEGRVCHCPLCVWPSWAGGFTPEPVWVRGGGVHSPWAGVSPHSQPSSSPLGWGMGMQTWPQQMGLGAGASPSQG